MDFHRIPIWSKAYKLYDLEARKVFVSRDVVFYENCFPYMQQKHDSQLPLTTIIPNEEDSLFQQYLQQYLQQTSRTTNDSAPTQPPGDIIVIQQSQSSGPPKPLPTIINASIPTRRSTRNHKIPSHFQHYVCSQTQTTWCNLIALPPEHMACRSGIEEFPEPTSYKQAVKHPGWVEARNKVISALQTNNTWEVVDLPSDKRAISCI